MLMRQRNSLILGVMLTVLLLAGCAGKGTRGQTNDAASAQALVDEAAHVLSLSLDKAFSFRSAAAMRL